MDYGGCPCGGIYDNRVVEVRFTAVARETPVVLSDVPQGACPVCASRVYKAQVLDCVETVHARSVAPGRR